LQEPSTTPSQRKYTTCCATLTHRCGDVRIDASDHRMLIAQRDSTHLVRGRGLFVSVGISNWSVYVGGAAVDLGAGGGRRRRAAGAVSCCVCHDNHL